jgi:hypothetical protein
VNKTDSVLFEEAMDRLQDTISLISNLNDPISSILRVNITSAFNYARLLQEKNLNPIDDKEGKDAS